MIFFFSQRDATVTKPNADEVSKILNAPEQCAANVIG